MYKLKVSNNQNIEIYDEMLINKFDLNELIKKYGYYELYKNLNIKEAFIPIVIDKKLYNNFNNFSILYNSINNENDKDYLKYIYLKNIFDIISNNSNTLEIMKPIFNLIKQVFDKENIISCFKNYIESKAKKIGLGSGVGNGLLYIVVLSIEDDKEKAFEIYIKMFLIFIILITKKNLI